MRFEYWKLALGGHTCSTSNRILFFISSAGSFALFETCNLSLALEQFESVDLSPSNPMLKTVTSLVLQ